jgi:large exoprotein involved in heme utilization and adhesion
MLFNLLMVYRPSDQTSDITATSELGAEFNGVVRVNAPNLDPTNALVPLDQNFIDPSQQIETGCHRKHQNSLTVVGRGGIPNSPNDPFIPQTYWIDLGSFEPTIRDDRLNLTDRNSTFFQESELTPAIVEATGWNINSQGQVVLWAENSIAPNLNPTCTDLYSSLTH